MSGEIKVGTPRKPMHCKDCGSCDCPQVNATPLWSVCPAVTRRRRIARALRNYPNMPVDKEQKK